MANFKVGTFTSAGSTGNQSVTGVGFRPSGIILLRGIATGVNATAIMQIGVGSGPSNRFVVNYRSNDNLTDSDTHRIFKSDKIVCGADAAGTINTEADLVSLDSDGFTLNWTNVGTGAQSYSYIAFSEDLSIHVGTFDLNSGTGNQSITGTGFQPKAVLFFNARNDTTEGVEADASLSIGAATAASARWAHSGIDTDNLATTDCARNGSTSKCLQRTSTAAVVAEADLVSMDGNGFTINVTTGQATRWGYIAIGGVTAAAGTVTARTTNGSQAYTGVGFQPELLLFAGEAHALAAFQIAAFGAAVSSSERTYIAASSSDNIGASNTARVYRTDKCIGFPSVGGGAVDVEADLTSMDSDGFTLNWTTTDGVARGFSYLALKISDPVGASGGGSGWMWAA